MNLPNISLFIFTALFFMIAAQAGYFLTGYYKVLNNLPAEGFMLVRKGTDAAVRTNFKIFYISGLLSGIVVLLFHKEQLGSARGILLCLAVFLLLADLVLAKTVSEAINHTISEHPVEQLVTMPGLQEKWLTMIFIRGSLSMAGFLLLVSALVFTGNQS